MKRLLLTLMVLMIILTGCSSKYFRRNSPESLFLQLAVQRVAYNQFQAHPGWKVPAIRVAEATINAIDGKTVTDLGSASEFIKSRVPMDKLLPAERTFVVNWIDSVMDGIQEDMKSQGIDDPSEEVIRVRQVLVWIVEMAKL